jgi:phosphoadenosine phosphosulfate reductase
MDRFLTDRELADANWALHGATAQAIVAWALERDAPAMATTSMGPGSAVMLHLLAARAPGLPVVWIDTGYNSAETYRFAEQLRQRLQLDLRVYAPQLTAARREALFGPIPTIEERDAHARFTQQVKLEPFQRALDDLRPGLWLTGIRREETDHRRSLDVLSRDPRGMIKVAPLFHFSGADMRAYLRRHDLPENPRYFDPTKVFAGRECGLHTAA